MIHPAFIGMTLTFQSVRSSLIIRSLIKAEWSIFIMRVAISLVTCYLMMIFTWPKSFILYSISSDFFNALRITMIFNVRRKLSIYILTTLILQLFSDCWMRMLGSPFSYLKPILLQKAMMFWFQSCSDYLNPYRLLSSLHNSLFRTWQSSYIPDSSRMNMGIMLSSDRLSRYALTIST